MCRICLGICHLNLQGQTLRSSVNLMQKVTSLGQGIISGTEHSASFTPLQSKEKIINFYRRGLNVAMRSTNASRIFHGSKKQAGVVPQITVSGEFPVSYFTCSLVNFSIFSWSCLLLNFFTVISFLQISFSLPITWYVRIRGLNYSPNRI